MERMLIQQMKNDVGHSMAFFLNVAVKAWFHMEQLAYAGRVEAAKEAEAQRKLKKKVKK